MRTVLTVAAFLFGLTCTNLQADFMTPFVEDTGLGETATRLCWIITEEAQGVTQDFIVLARSDTMEFIPLRATAEAGVVNPEYLGRPVMVTAKKLERDGAWSVLHIFKVEPAKN